MRGGIKRWGVPLLLAAVPYLFMGTIAWIFTDEAQLTEEYFIRTMERGFAAAVALYLLGCIFAFASPRLGISTKQLAFWNLVIKLSYAPFYVLGPALGHTALFALVMMGKERLIAGFAAMSVLCLWLSSAFGCSALRQLRKGTQLSRGDMVLYTLCHFIFFLDMIAAAALYRKLKGHTNEKP